MISAALVFVIPSGAADLLGSIAIKPLSSSAMAWSNGLTNLIISIAVVTVLALTEEIGWRGYLLPRIQRTVSKRKAALAVGFVHAMFHAADGAHDVRQRRQPPDRRPDVVVTLTAAGVFYAWLKDRSGSVQPVAVAHVTVNVLIDGAA